MLNSANILNRIIRYCPDASARILGSSEFTEISGKIAFYQMRHGVIVAAEVRGLPAKHKNSENQIFAFHIHEGTNCSGDGKDAFSGASGHYNPEGFDHPNHRGDMPPLFSNGGYAFSVFVSDRFSVRDIIGKTAIIHSNPDDFSSQPSGNSGRRIACGEITKG